MLPVQGSFVSAVTWLTRGHFCPDAARILGADSVFAWVALAKIVAQAQSLPG